MIQDLHTELGSEWHHALHKLFELQPLLQLCNFLKKELVNGATIYPLQDEIFRAFQITPLSNVRIVWLGQDPYHGPDQAEGLSFSVKNGQALPPSLLNIYKELQADKNIPISQNGSLKHWALQGILLLNTTLTVRAHEPLSHQGQGWEFFTDKVIETLAQQEQPICFVLLGRHARQKKTLITKDSENRHHVIEAVHPSPLSAHRGFLGSRIFSQIEAFLSQHHYKKILWDAAEFEKHYPESLSSITASSA